MRRPSTMRPHADDPHAQVGGRDGARSKAMSKGSGHRTGVSTPLPTLSRRQGILNQISSSCKADPSVGPRVGASVETSAIEEAAIFRTDRRRMTPGSRSAPMFAAPAPNVRG